MSGPLSKNRVTSLETPSIVAVMSIQSPSDGHGQRLRGAAERLPPPRSPRRGLRRRRTPFPSAASRPRAGLSGSRCARAGPPTDRASGPPRRSPRRCRSRSRRSRGSGGVFRSRPGFRPARGSIRRRRSGRSRRPPSGPARPEEQAGVRALVEGGDRERAEALFVGQRSPAAVRLRPGSSTSGVGGASRACQSPPASWTMTTVCSPGGRSRSRPTRTPPPPWVIRGESRFGTGPRYGCPASSTGTSKTCQPLTSVWRTKASCGSGWVGLADRAEARARGCRPGRLRRPAAAAGSPTPRPARPAGAAPDQGHFRSRPGRAGAAVRTAAVRCGPAPGLATSRTRAARSGEAERVGSRRLTSPLQLLEAKFEPVG